MKNEVNRALVAKKKKILFMSSAKLTAISIGLLLAVFCTIGMSFRPVYDEDEAAEIVMSGPRRGHYAGTCSDTKDKDYFKATAVTMGHGTVSLANAGGGGVITSSNTNPTSTATANASVSIEWNCNETTKTGTAANHKHSFTWTATPTDGYNFIGWSTSSSAGDIFTLENPYTYETVYSAYGEENSHNASNKALETKFYAHFEKQVIANITFGASANGQYTYSCTAGSGTVTTADQGPVETGEAISMAAVADGGYKFFGWYTNTDVPTNYVSYVANVDLSFKSDVTLYAKFIPSTTPVWLIKETGARYYDLAAAISACGSATRTIVLMDNGQLAVGNYTIPTNVTLLIPYDAAFTVQTSPRVVTSAATLMAYKILTLQDNVNIICNGKICVAGQMMAGSGGSKSAYVTGACGMIDMSSGGHIELNNGSKLYVWGFVKGQDMEQGNNTTGVGTITANAGSVIWEDFSIGDWRGGTATDAINNKKSSWKLFPFQSYSIQNIEVPVTYQYQSQLNIYTALNATGGPYDASVVLIGSSSALFLTQDAQSVVRKWYDPTSDLTCYELSGTSQIDALSVNISGIVNVNSGDFYLPISNNMHIILANCNMTLSKPMTMQAGAVIEVKAGAIANLESRLHMFDKDEWGKYIHNYYFRSFNNLTSHKNRGEEGSKDGLEDAKIIVDGTLNVVSGKGYLYSTDGGANVMGNGGGKIVFGGALPDGTTIHNVTVGTKDQDYIVDAPNAIASANLHNEDDSYTKSIGSTTFHNVDGRWFTAAAKDSKADHTYDFTYIKSGVVSGTGGTDTLTNACYSNDKTGLEARMKWVNIDPDACSNWWIGHKDTYFYNWTINSDWHQFMPTATEGMYSGSNNKIYTKTDCVWEELGETDVNCLYTIGGVKKALVEGEFIALEPNNNDPAYHAADDATKYYICFSGCNWHEATKYTEEEKAYIISPDTFIWYDNAWMSVNFQEPFAYTMSETNVPIYYEYLNSEWVLAEPYVRVVDGTEDRSYYFIEDAFKFANSVLRTAPTITILRDISGITTALTYTGANKTCTLDLNGHTITGSVTNMITVNAAGCTFYIVDNTEQKKGKIHLIFSVNNSRLRAFYVQNGHVILNSGTIAATNTLAYSSTNTKPYAEGLLVANGKTFTMNGGRIEVSSAYNPYGIEGASGTPTININGGTIETVAETRDSPYAIYGYGTVNVTNGTINAIAKASSSAMGIYIVGNGSTANISGGAILARATSSAQGVRCWGSATVTGDYNAETPNNTPKSRSYSIMNITGGTITAECTTSTTSYGVLSYGTTNISGGTITSTVQKSNQNTAYGVHTAGGTTTISAGANIIANAPTKAYGVTATGANGDSNRGWPHVGVVNITGGTITANTTNTTTAYGLLVTGATWTINKTNGYSVFNGDYASAGTATVSGGTFNANAKTTLSRGIAVAATVTKNAASATPKCTINGGYYKMTGTGDVLGCNASALPADFQIKGGYYSHEGNLATYVVSPKQVLTLASDDANRPPYYYKVAEAYLVTFKNEDGTANIIDPVYQEVGTAPVCSTEPTKASTSTNSFTFDGWATAANGDKVYEKNGLPNVTSAGATYYAHFATTTLKYRVHFDAATNGGECATENIYVNPGTAVGELPSATKYGYTFNGWFTTASGGTKLEATTVINADADYYAQFTANSHTLTWDLDGGKVSTAGKIGSTTWPAQNVTGTPSTSVAYGTILTTIPVVTKTGYTFNRWDPVPTSSMPDEDVTYTALWNPNTNTKYTVKHYLQNVDGTYPADPVETQSLTGTTATSVTPEVKEYEGFTSPATQTKTIAADGKMVVEYQYARRRYTFTLDAYTNGGTSDVPSIEVIHGATIGAVPPDAQKGCNDFTGWYTKPVGGVKITPEFVIEYDMKTLYAQFSDDVRTYPITYNAGANGTGAVAAGTKTCGEDATLSSSTFTRTGYTQTGWSLTDGGAQAYALDGTYTENAALTLYPVWTLVTYNLTYEGLNGATNSNPGTYTIGTATITLANPGKRAGYTFTGWTCGGSPLTQIALGSTGDKTITANWSAVTYNLTYEGLNGATNSNPATYTIETATITLANPGTRAGYTFTGWTCGGSPLTQIALGSTGDKTITANWSAVTYNLTYEGLNGATNSNPETYTIETATITLANPGTRAGYAFTGWTCGGSPLTQIALGSTGDKVITANWGKIGVTILWKSEDGKTTLETDEGVEIDATPSFNGETPTKITTAEYTYTFDGWTTEANGAGTFYAIGELPAVAAAAAYYAHFTATPNVASVTVGGETTYYPTIADAWDFVNDQTANTTIKLLRDATATESLVFTPAAAMTCTLDLNNHTLSGAVSKLININLAKSTFIITDSSDDKNGKVLAEYSVNARLYGVYLTAGTLNLKAGTIHAKNAIAYSSNKSAAATGLYVIAGQTFTMDGGTIESESQYSAFGLYIAKSTSSKVTINDGLIKGHTTSTTTAYGIYNYCTKLTINGGHIIGHAWTNTSCGLYQYGKATINGGTIEATNDTTKSKGSTKAYGIYGIYYSTTYNGAVTIPSTSTVKVLAKARTNTAYAVYIPANSNGNTIDGGTFTAIAKTGKTAIGLYNLGGTTVSGGTFNVTTKTTTAYGLYATRGTITVNDDPTFNVTAGSTTAYGAFAYGTINAKGGGKYSGTININGGTFNVTSTSSTAYGAYAGLYGLNIEQKTETVGDTIFGQHYMPGIISITDGTFKVKAKTTSAYGIVVAAAKSESGAVGTTLREPKATITGGLFKIESAGDANATAYAMNTKATVTNLDVQGGKYSTKRTNESETSNIEDKYTAPTKDCIYHVLPLEGEDPYKYEVAEAYTITFKNGETTMQEGPVKNGTTPTYNGETPTKDGNAQYTYTFDGWSTTDGGDKLAALPAVAGEATYYAHFAQTENKYTVSVAAGANGSVSPASVSEIGCETASGDITATPEAGYRFVNWTLPEGVTAANGYSATSNPIHIHATAADKTITANFVARTDINYTVKHYQQNIANDEYTEVTADQETKQGTTATATAATAKTYTGFTALPITQETIAGDGSTVVSVYYNRNTFAVTWNWNESGTPTTYSDDVKYGAAPVYTYATPTKPSDATYNYTFTGWSDGTITYAVGAALPAVTAVTTYTATFSKTENKYTVSVAAGANGSVSPASVSGIGCETASGDITATPEAGYRFVNWTLPEGVTAANGYSATSNPIHIHATAADKTITANFVARTDINYTVKHWQQNIANDEYTEVTADQETKQGTTATATAATAKTYTGFTAQPISQETIAGDGTTVVNIYYNRKTYTIAWVDGDGNTVKTDANVKYGAIPVYAGETLTKTATAQYTYTFDGWSETEGGDKLASLPVVSKDATYFAHYASTVNNYTVSIAATPAGYGTVSAASVAEVPYGSDVTVNGNTITVNGTAITATPAENTAEYTYTFDHWENVPATVMGNVDNIQAVFTRTLRSYTVRWENYNGDELETDLNVAYGATPTYNGATPTYNGATPADEVDPEYNHTFDGWTPEISPVTGDVTYTAKYTSTKKKYTITWKDMALTTVDHVIKTDTLEWHNTPSFYYQKESDERYSYVFLGWSPEVTLVEGNATYVAQYNAVPLNMIVEDDETIPGNVEVVTTTVKVSGHLTINEGAQLTTNDLILEASGTGSGDINGADRVQLRDGGKAYFDYTFDVDPWHWSAFGVPFEIDLKAAAPLKETTTPMVLGSDYDIVYYDSDERAAHGPSSKCWKYVEYDAERKLTPGKLYMIAFNRPVGHVNVVRFTKAAEAAIDFTANVALTTTGTGDDNNWNGIANPRMYHALLDAGVTECQVHDGGEIGKDGYYTYDMNDKKFFVGKAAFVQVPNGKSVMTTTQATDQGAIVAKAPRRNRAEINASRYDVQIAPMAEEMSDRVFLLTDEDKADEYVIVSDLAKAGVSPVRPQLWVNRYGVKLCKNTIAMRNNVADYPLGISVPADGSYDIFLEERPNNDDMLYLTYDGEAIWNLSYGACTIDLQRGTTDHYGLRVVAKTPQVATGIEETTIQNGDAVRKVIVEDKVFIIRNGQIFGIDGRLAK